MDAAGPSSSSARPPTPTFIENPPTPTIFDLPPFLARENRVRQYSISPPPPPHLAHSRRLPHRTRTRVPAPVVVNVDHREDDASEEPDPERDLWLSTADGRFSSPVISIRVGQIPNIQTFYAHRTVLLKAKWFERALCSGFRETASQEIDLPEENPAIFHFVIAFLYENRYFPIQAASSALEPETDKGKGKDNASDAAADDNSEVSSISRASSDSMMRDSIRASLEMPRVATKERGVHRVDCRCSRCANDRQRSRQCLQCGAFAEDDPPATSGRRSTRHIRNRPLWLHENLAETVSQPSLRIPPEDMRTWLMVYELNLDVYICAVRLLIDDLQKAVMRSTVDMLETAGTEAAQVKVLQLCAKLHAGVPETDSLLHMILARVGFLQSLLWQKAPAETSEFLIGNPELAAMMLRETSRRHDNEDQYRILPAMEVNSPPIGTMVRYAGRPPDGFMA